ncbi:MAG TPA: MarP family serine protease [Actinomycetota bacterium]|nr:MarP family serine protease [Actinomycetota bacterium]
MNLADLVILLLAGLAAYRGFRHGLVGQFFELGGGFLGLVLGVTLAGTVADAFDAEPGFKGLLISLLTVFILLSLGQTAGHLIGHRFGAAARAARLGGVNAGLGAGFGIFVTLVSYWMIGSLLVHGPWPEVARLMSRSEILKQLNDVSEPPDVLAYLRQYLDTAGFPQVFTGLPRPIGEPVDLPPGRLARRAARRAQASTVRIVVPACGGQQLGSGWIGAPDTVVTNAHVVAGGTEIQVQDDAGTHSGRVVLFDPATDVAIVHVAGLAGPPLDLNTGALERGTPGATLGYPGADAPRLDTDPAAVQNSYPARGRDIYGRDDVTREVYELRASIRQGESGGPFALPSGQVGGVVFAASTTDGNVGYALTGAEIVDELEEGAARTEPVSTGDCAR